ncbi:MAG: hypothetical protein JWM55_1298 [Acidimicrobiaceae bacterium]|nr:hypothetical protein [Acidimicrobiaceae bacterium]
MAKSVVPEFTSWTGWDVRGGKNADPDAAGEFERGASKYPNAETRYELLAVAGRGFRPPGFLVSIDLDRKDDLGLLADVEHLGLRQAWSTLYRQIAETKPAHEKPFAIYLLGVNPPPDISPHDLNVFNDFYTRVHLVEVAERRRALRAVRYELVEETRPPYLGAPRFLAAYEVDEASASQRRHVGPAYSSGPDVWQRHTTPWRLWYRRLGA